LIPRISGIPNAPTWWSVEKMGRWRVATGPSAYAQGETCGGGRGFAATGVGGDQALGDRAWVDAA
jgi:hypothetical protein